MATTQKTTQRKRGTTAAKTAPRTEAAVEKKASTATETKTKSYIIPEEINPTQIITVVNGFQGTLVYISPRTKEKFVWDEFGAEQEMELRELRNAKSSAKAFFINNWFMFKEEDKWVIDYLGLNQFYSNSIDVEDFDELFEKSPSEIIDIINHLSEGQKKSLRYRALQLISDKQIDSNKVIDALNTGLNLQLIQE